MAVIGKIRNRLGGLLVVLVGGALLLFVVSDFLDSRQGFASGTRSIGTIGGEDVDLAAFDRRVNDEVESLREDFGQSVGSDQQEQIRNQVWNEVVRERVLKSQLVAAGFGEEITQEEYDDIRFGENIQGDFKGQPQFQGPDGQPDPKKIHEWFLMVEERSPSNNARRGYAEIYRGRMSDGRLYAKYNDLVKKSIFANSAQAKDEYEQKNLKATFDLVAKAYNAEPDSLYPVGEGDLTAYYNAHKGEKKYKQQASRSFDYVEFKVVATEEDKAAIRKELEGLVDGFRSAPNDSVFCVGNAESRAYTVIAYAPNSLDAQTDSLITNADTGAVVGPYLEGNSLKLAKVRELASVPEARVRHILFSTQGKSDDEAAKIKQRADSVLAVVKRDKSKFEAMVTKYTEDPGSKGTGGVYEWFDRNKMVPEFTKASFDEKVGATTICKTTYGYHIVEVLGQRDRKERRICTVDRSLVPSPKTFQTVYKRANEFSLEGNTAEKFQSKADTFGLEVKKMENLQLGQKFVNDLQQPNALVGWVNNAEVGQVSEPRQCGDTYVVALLKGIKEEGPPALDDVRETFTAEVVKEKKGEAYKQKMAGATDLGALAGTLGVQVQTASDMAYSSFNIPGGYSENEVIGRMFALPDGQVGGPFVGDNGVYVVKKNSTTVPPESSDLSTERKSLADRKSGSAEYLLLNALRDAAGVVDERGKFYQ